MTAFIILNVYKRIVSSNMNRYLEAKEYNFAALSHKMRKAIIERAKEMAPSSDNMISKMRLLIAEETALPRAFHIPTPSAGQFDDLNEAIINAIIKHIDWKLIEAEN